MVNGAREVITCSSSFHSSSLWTISSRKCSQSTLNFCKSCVNATFVRCDSSSCCRNWSFLTSKCSHLKYIDDWYEKSHHVFELFLFSKFQFENENHCSYLSLSLSILLRISSWVHGVLNSLFCSLVVMHGKLIGGAWLLAHWPPPYGWNTDQPNGHVNSFHTFIPFHLKSLQFH